MIIALASQKGGTGKTTTAAAIWAGCPRSLAVDLDAQGNLTLITGANSEASHDVYDVLTGDCSIHDAAQTLSMGDIIPSSEGLSNVDSLLPDTLRNILRPIAGSYRHIVIDTPPALNIITLNALVAADVLVIPIQADILSLQGVRQVQKILEAVREINPKLCVAGILLTRYNPRSNVRRQMHEVAEQFAVSLGTRVFKTTIREAVAVLEAQVLRTDIFTYAPQKNVTADYRAFIAELEAVIGNA